MSCPLSLFILLFWVSGTPMHNWGGSTSCLPLSLFTWQNIGLSTPEQLRCLHSGVWEPGNEATSTWQFQVELKHYSIVYLDHITASCSTELPLRVGVIQVAQLCPVCTHLCRNMSPTLNSEVLGFSVSNMINITIHNKIILNIYQGAQSCSV